MGMAGAIADGYATATTDAGLGDAYDPLPWSFVSPGNVNLYALQNLGLVSLGDEVSELLANTGVHLTVTGNHRQGCH
jgi:hypothetical protein